MAYYKVTYTDWVDAEISGLPERIILTSSDKDNDSVWIYTKTQTYYGYQEVPRRVIEKKK